MTAATRNTRLRSLRAGAAALLLCATAGVAIAPAEPAVADAVTVPYIDRLGCGTTDAAVTPIFSWNGSGVAANGAGYTATTDASAFPSTTGVFSNVSGGQAFTVYTPQGYGSDFQYRGAGGLGFPQVQAGRAATLTMTLPQPQAVQFTLGGMQSPTQVTVSGAGPGGAVTANAVARGGAPGNATVAQVGSAVRATGATVQGGADEQPGYAVDVWFPQPVTELTIQLQPTAGGQDSGFIITPPVACQAGTVATDAVVGSPAVDAASGTVAYDVQLSTTVSNDAPATGAVLYPVVSAPLAFALAAQGIALQSVSATGASASACQAVGDLDGSGPLIAAGAGYLAPGEECTLSWTASVSMPQSQASRTAQLASALASSATSAARQKSAASTAMEFPGLSSDLAVTDTGAVSALPARQVNRTATVVNNGNGAALGTALSLQIPSGLTASGYPSSCTPSDATLSCTIENLATGGSATVPYTLTVSSSASPGTRYVVTATASATSQPGTASASYTVNVVAPPAVAPPPGPVPRPSPTPSPTPTPPPAPVPSTVPVAPPVDVQGLTPVNLSLGAAELVPGTVSAMRGTLGPNAADRVVTITLSGRVNQGLVYRTVRAMVGEEASACDVAPREFTCEITLEPGESAALEVRLFTDAVNAPDSAIQQLITEGDSGSLNSLTVTTPVAGASDTDEWASDLVMDMSSMPGAFLPLLAMMLFALAATVVERQRNRY